MALTPTPGWCPVMSSRWRSSASGRSGRPSPRILSVPKWGAGEDLGRSREFLAFIACCMAMAAVSIDMLLPAFPDIRREFHLASDSTAPSGLITAFFLGLAFGMLFYGPLSDRYGRKKMLVTGLVIYALSAVAASFATTLGG